MIDPRFYSIRNDMCFADVLKHVGEDKLIGEIDETAAKTVLNGAGTVPFLKSRELGFISDAAYGKLAAQCESGIVLVSRDFDLPVPDQNGRADSQSLGNDSACTFIQCDDPYLVFTKILDCLYSDSMRLLGYCASTSPDTLGNGAHLSPHVYFGSDVEIGDNVVIGPHTMIGRGVTIGHDVIIGDNVSIQAAHIGDRAVIHSGARIGSEGFGFLPRAAGPQKIPQLGRVILQNGVEIGANSCVDRGTLDDTIIGENTKIDNLVQVGHNTKIGRNCQIAAKSGFAGSSEIGDNVLFGGRASIVNKAKLGDRCVVMACSIVSKSQRADTVLAGNPAVDVKQWRRMQAKLKMMGRE